MWVNSTYRANLKKVSYFLFFYSVIGRQMKINNVTSFFILSMNSLLVSILSSPFFHPFSLTTGQLLLVCFILDSVSYSKFSVSCWFDSVLTLTNNTYTGHMRHAKGLHLAQKTHLQKIYFCSPLSFIVVLK